MASATNGTIDHAEGSQNPSAHLGKRKRTSSPEPKTEDVSKAQSIPVQRSLEDALRLIQKHDPSGNILKYSLPSAPIEPSSKRQKTSSSNAQADNIGIRILNETYKSVNELISDVTHILASVSQETRANGHAIHVDTVKELLLDLEDTQLHFSTSAQINGLSTVEIENHSKTQVLSLRCQTDRGMKQLYSGLPNSTSGSIAETDGRKLPYGFELTELTMMESSKRPSKDNRTFGEVFGPHRNTKPLEAPRPDKRHRDVSTLDFVQPYTTSKYDQKNVVPDPGTWLEYSGDGSQPSKSKKSKTDKETPMSLFITAYSSFAPTTDHSRSVISDADHSRRWWREYSAKNTYLDLPETSNLEQNISDIQQGVSINPPEENFTEDHQIKDFKPDENFQELIDNFISEEDSDESDETEKLLNEISELLETLRSYQIIRESEHARGPSSAHKPTKPEIDVYDLLKSQLQILISDLPPYAVAKLNGDQLEALNISTNLLVVPPEFNGTAHADEHTLRRARAAQGATTAVTRPNPVPATRNNYGTPAAAYNNQAYNRNVPATAYTARPGSIPYNTPRGVPAQTAPYNTPNYRAASAMYPNSTIQQFQRAVANGLAQPNTPTPYMSRPPQSNSQPVRTASDLSQNGLANGQTPMYGHVRQQEHAVNGVGTTTSQADLNQRMTDSVKLLQQQTALTRRASGTPQPLSNSVSQTAATGGAPS